jgi:hypothetical protein
LKNGTEMRAGGTARITTRILPEWPKYVSYQVEFFRDGEWVKSKNGQWDYLNNARSDADGGKMHEKNNRIN